MHQLLYGLSLIASITSLGVVDYRFRLAFFGQRLRTMRTVGLGVICFVAWDSIGIALGIFYTGSSQLITGIFLGPEFPIEEALFLILLVYTTLIIWRSLERWA